VAVVAGIAATSNHRDADEETQRTTQGGPEKTPHAGKDPPPEVEFLPPRPAAGSLFPFLPESGIRLAGVAPVRKRKSRDAKEYAAPGGFDARIVRGLEALNRRP